MKKYFQDKENRIIITTVIITLIIASLPLFSRYCITGHDSEYHILRIEALKEGILKGVPFLKINVLFFGGAGYASSMFYPDFLLYFPALLRAAGVHINESVHIFVFMCIALCFISSYFSVFFMTKNKYAALMSGVLFTLCSYHLDDIYVRAAVGEYTAFIFLPVFLYGLYNICYENMDKPQLLSLSLAGILLCHTLSFVLCVIITAVIIIINAKKFIENKKIILKLMLWAFITIALTASYLFPMLEQLLIDKFYVSNEWINPAQETMHSAGLFGVLFPTVGAGLLLCVLPRIIIKRNKSDNLLKFADECIVLGFISVFASLDIFPWDKIGRIAGVIQFPWRLFQIGSALLAMAGAVVLYRFCQYIDEKNSDSLDDKSSFISNKTGSVVTIIVLIVMTFTCLMSYAKQDMTYYDFSYDYYSYKPFTANVIAGEWLPTRVTDIERLVEQSEHAYSADGNDVPFSRIKGTVRICPKGEVIGEYIDAPLIYYKGYAAKTDSGQELRVDGSGDNGLTRVYLDGNKDNFTVYYKGTPIQHISKIISIVTAIGILLFAFLKKRNTLKNTEKEA